MKRVLYFTGIFTIISTLLLVSQVVIAQTAPITGNTSVCISGTDTLNDLTTGGAWTSSDTTIATVDNTLGIVTGIAAGTVTITYTPLTGDPQTFAISVNALPNAFISGNTNICNGSVLSISVSGTPGATITMSDNGIITLDGSGNGTYTVIPEASNTYNILNVSLAGCSQPGTGGYTVTLINYINTYAGNGSAGYSGDGGQANAALFNGPSQVFYDAEGNILVADEFNSVIRKISPVGVVTTIAGSGVAGFGGDGGPATAAQLGYPAGVCEDAAGNIYIADMGNALVWKVSTSGIITSFAGNASLGYGYSGDGGNATDAQIYGPSGVCVDPSGNLYIADNNGAIRMVNTSGIISTFAGGPGYGYSGDGGLAIYAAFDGTAGVASDNLGNIYISDEFNNVIREVNTSGIINTVVGNGYGAGMGSSFGGAGIWAGDGGPATNASLNGPVNLTFDGSGNMYIVDYFNEVIRIVNSAGIINTVAGIPYYGGYSGDGGPAIDGLFSSPNGVCADNSGNIYVSDIGSNAIRIIGAVPYQVITGSNQLCTGTTITLSDTAVAGVWNATNTNGSVAGGVVTATNAGMDTITNSVAYTCGTSIAYDVVNIFVTPTATLTGTSFICTGTGETISITGTPNATITFGSGTINTLDNNGIDTFSYFPASDTAFSITTVSEAICSSAGTGSVNVTVNAMPSASISGSSTICYGSYADILFTGTPGALVYISDGGEITLDGSGLGEYFTSPSSTTTYYINNVSLGGCSQPGTDSAVVTVIPLPVATVSGTATICNGASVTLNVTGTASASINFSDAGSITLDGTGNGSYSVTPLVSTNYTISQVAIGGCTNTGSGSAMVTVNAIPTATITGGTSLCSGYSTVLTISGSAGASISISDGGNITLDGSGNGTYTVSPTSTTDYTINNVSLSGCSQSGTGDALITVIGSPTATVSGSTTICNGSQAVLTVTGSPFATIAFSDGGNIILDGYGNGSYSVTPSVTTNYNITSVSLGSCSNSGSGSVLITINALPTASISGSATICMGSSTYLSVSGTAGSLINFSDGGIITLDGSGNGTYSVSPLSNTTYSITSVSLSGCNAAGNGTAIIAVNAIPSATISGSTTICNGTQANLTFSGTPGAGVSISDGGNITLNGSGNGNYTVNPTVTTNYNITEVTLSGCTGTGSGSAMVTVNAIPTATVSGSTTICNGSSANLSVSGTPLASVTFSDLGNINLDGSGNGTYIVSPGANTTYTITSVSLNGCSAPGTGTAVISVNAIPTATVTGSAIICNGSASSLTVNGTSGAAVLFSDGGNVILNGSGYGSYSVNPSATTSYTITTVSLLGCSQAGSGSALITVNSIPTATISGSSTICAGAQATIGVLGSAGAAITFSNGGNITLNGSGNGTYSFMPVSTSNYSITLVSLSGCTNIGTGSNMVNVTALPTATITGSATICNGVVTTLNINGTPLSGITLSSGRTLSLNGSGLGTCTVNPSVSTNYTINNVSLGGCSQAGYGNASITVNPIPGATISGTQAICIGSIATLSVTGTALSSILLSPSGSYTLNGSGNLTFTVNPAATTNYSITSVGLNGCSGSGTGNAVVTVSTITYSPSNFISTIAGTGTAGYSGDGSAATAAKLNLPYGVALDAVGNIYIADKSNNRVRKVNTAGIITTVAGTGTAGSTGDGGPATAAKLNVPLGIAVDASGNIYIADYGNNKIRIVNSSGIINTFAGTGTVGHTGDGGPATAGLLDAPISVCTDGSGNVYIADYFNNRVRVVNSSGIINTYAGNGTAGFTGDGGLATAAELNEPSGICLDASGNLYITDKGNSRVRVIRSGVIRTIAGTGTASYSGDGGFATAAKINSPDGIYVDAGGNIYIADYGNNRIRMINTSGIISTYAGNGTAGFTGNGGSATAAELNGPSGVVVDASGKVYIADYSNEMIRVALNPTMQLVTGSSAVCVGSSITLTDGTAGGVWSASNANATVINGVVYGNSNGVDTISYSITNGCGTGVSSGIVSVIATPTATISGSYMVCPGNIASVTVNGSPYASVTMSSGGIFALNASGSGIFTVSPAVSSIYSVTSVNTGGCGQQGIGTATVVVSVPSGTLTGSSTICLGNYAVLTVTGTPGASVSLSPSGTLTLNSFGTGIYSVSPVANTVYSITSVNNGSCSQAGSGMANITVNPVPSATVSGSVSICNGSPAILNVTGSSGAAINFSDGGNITLSGAGTGTYTVYPANSTIYSIVSVSTGFCTIAGTGNASVTVNAIPTATITGSSNICAGSVVTLSVTGSPYAAVSINSLGTYTLSSLGTGIFTVSPYTSTNYSVTLVNNGYCSQGGVGTASVIVTVIPATTSIISTFAGTGTAGYSGDGGADNLAKINLPYAVCFDASGNMYIADKGNNRIRKINTSGIISTYAGNGSMGSIGDGGPATAARLVSPTGIAFDNSGNLYIADYGNYRVRKVNASGIISTYAGTGVSGSSGDGGPATAATFNTPIDVATDTTGNVYIADLFNNKIRMVNTAGIITTIAGTGASSHSGDGGPATAATMLEPSFVFVDAYNNIFISDMGNNCIRKIASGIITNFAGNGTSGSTGDGAAATIAKLNSPRGLFVDKYHNVYVSDNGNNKIRVINSFGVISTYSGNGTAGYTGDGGNAATAELNGPLGITMDTSGNLYVADYTNERIRVISQANLLPVSAPWIICTGMPTTITDRTTGGLWSVSNTAATIIPGGIITGNYAGYDTISYIYSNSCGSASSVFVMSVSATPTATITGTTYICPGGATTLQVSGTPMASILLSNGGSFALNGSGTASYSVVPASTTTYTISNVSNATCAYAGSGSANVIVGVPTATITGSTNICSGTADIFTVSGTPGSQITLSPSGTFTLSAAGVNVYPVVLTAPATYSITNVSLGACYQPGSGSVNVTIAPVPSATVTGNLLLCGSSVATLSITGTPAAAVTLSNGAIDTLDSYGNGYYSFIPVTSGTYSISNVWLGGCSQSGIGTSTVAIYPMPNATITGSASICKGSIATITVTGTPNALITLNGVSTYSLNSSGNYFSSQAYNTSAEYYISNVSNGYCSQPGMDTANIVVNIIPNANSIVSTIAGIGYSGFTGDGGIDTLAKISGPYGICLDNSGNLYFADRNNNRIRMINTSGIITTVAGNGTAGYNGDGITATAASIYNPTGVAVDNHGNLYIADNGNNRVREVSSGIISTIAGNGIAGPESAEIGGPATNAHLNGPFGITLDTSGNIYISDYNNNYIKVVSPAGIMNIYAGTSIAGFSGDGGYATLAQLSGPSGLFMDNSGNLFVCEKINNRVRRIDASGIITTFAGNGLARSSGDGGTSTAASLYAPMGVYGDQSGNVYIVETLGERVRKVNASGKISTIIGTGGYGFNGNGLAATATELDNPIALTIDAGGNIYIADDLSNRIRKMNVAVLPPLTGPGSVCTAGSITLSDALAGGTWTASNPDASVSSGVVFGNSTGSVVIRYQYTNSCGSAAVYDTITVTSCGGREMNDSIAGTNIAVINNEESVSVYPNPSTGLVFIKADVEVDAKLTTIDGRLLMENNLVTELDMNRFANGIYFVTIYDHKTGMQLKIERIVKTSN